MQTLNVRRNNYEGNILTMLEKEERRKEGEEK